MKILFLEGVIFEKFYKTSKFVDIGVRKYGHLMILMNNVCEILLFSPYFPKIGSVLSKWSDQVPSLINPDPNTGQANDQTLRDLRSNYGTYLLRYHHHDK